MQLAVYHDLLDNAQAMLQAASEERWDDIPMLDDERQHCLSSLQGFDNVANQPEHAQACVELIQAILASDMQTKALIEARQKELGSLLGSVGKEKKLAHFYRDI